MVFHPSKAIYIFSSVYTIISRSTLWVFSHVYKDSDHWYQETSSLSVNIKENPFSFIYGGSGAYKCAPCVGIHLTELGLLTLQGGKGQGCQFLEDRWVTLLPSGSKCLFFILSFFKLIWNAVIMLNVGWVPFCSLHSWYESICTIIFFIDIFLFTVCLMRIKACIHNTVSNSFSIN